MSKKKQPSVSTNEVQIDENSLFSRVAEIIEVRKSRAGAYANREVTLMYWEIGHYINSVVLGDKRAEYGKKILTTLSAKLVDQYGKAFELRNVRRMIQFANDFPDFEIVSTLSTQLTWSHFIEVLPIDNENARMYYANEAAQRRLGVHELRHQNLPQGV